MERPVRVQRRRARPRLELLEARQLLATFRVTSVADSGPGSLRQAILDVNADPAGGGPVDAIDFAIPGAGVRTIAPATPLPAVLRPVVVDATTQPGYAGLPLVVLDGASVASPGDSPDPGRVVGLQIAPTSNAAGTKVLGLGIVRFTGTGLRIDAAGAEIRGVAIGTDVVGTAGLGNGGYGIDFGATVGNRVFDSLIMNNGLRAIGTVADAPGRPTPSDGYVATSNVAQSGNGTQATTLRVATTRGTAVSTVGDNTGAPFTLTYTVTNTGSLPAHAVNVALTQDFFSQGLTVLGGTILGATDADPIVATTPASDRSIPNAARLGTLAPGQTVTLELTVRANAGSYFSPATGQLTAIASSPQLDYNPFDTAATYLLGAFNTGGPGQPTADSDATTLHVTTPAGTYFDTDVQWGSVVAMQFTVSNIGTVDARDVTMGFGQAVFARIFRVISATTTQGTIGDDLNLNGTTTALATIGTLAPGQAATVTLVAKLDDEGIDGNSDIITGGAMGSNVTPTFGPGALYTWTPIRTGTSPPPGGWPIDPGPITNPDPITNPGPISDPDPVIYTGTTTDPVPTTGTGTTIDPAPAVNLHLNDPSVPATVAPADLTVSAAMPFAPGVGSAGLLVYTIRNVGSGGAGRVVVRLDLGVLPAGSFYAIVSQGSTGAAGILTPVDGEPGVYQVDLGSMAAGASGIVAVLLKPATAGPLGVMVAASDANAPGADPNPTDNLAFVGAVIAPTKAAAITTGHHRVVRPAATRGHTATATPAATADTLVNVSPAATVRPSSIAAGKPAHRFTVRAAHPAPVTSTATVGGVRKRRAN